MITISQWIGRYTGIEDLSMAESVKLSEVFGMLNPLNDSALKIIVRLLTAYVDLDNLEVGDENLVKILITENQRWKATLNIPIELEITDVIEPPISLSLS
jgi:hypothetical protein